MATRQQNNGTMNGAHDLHNQQVHTVAVPDTARCSGIASAELLAEAITYLHRDGIIILENAINSEHLDALNALLEPEAVEIANDPNHHFNFGKQTRNMDQAPPLIPDLMYQDIWTNPIVCSVTKAILGEKIVCHYANGNTALGPATGRQPVHSDIDQPHPLFPFAYIINIPLSDVNLESGATEVWVGSHRDSCVDQHTTDIYDNEAGLTIKPELLELRRKHSPPINPSTKKGSLIIRDVRLWHAGVPNKTHKPRIMLAFVYQPRWYQAPSKVLLPLKARPLIERWQGETGLEFNAEWVDGEVDHKKLNSNEVDFSSRNKKMLELETLMHPSRY
ncbi:hypothetical protein LTR37_005196 [Vermiconidia calcicola]|uniref:Uncharacterized protein n=1 Tax=Vermiconidia calcicola TaxID=1690605 RepID=A0ACC3NK76_9PEZI|nr:hypothetical protein LTR37_005196 [Vermiconidia calcicola]